MAFADDIAAVARIDAVPRILEVVCRTTGLGFAAVARVTEDRWIACAVRDDIAFGLLPGGELPVETTICHEIRQSGRLVAIDEVACDGVFRHHPTPQMYGFQSYISVPIVLSNGRFFGTLCAIDPKPARVNTPATIKMFTLFAELIAFHLEARDRVAELERAVAARTSELRDLNAALAAQMETTDADRQVLRALTARLERVREDERTTIARELHDAFGQSLTALKFDLAAARRLLGAPSGPSVGVLLTAIGDMEATVDGALDDIDRIVADLRPAVLDALGCVAAAEWLVSQVGARSHLRTGFTADAQLDLPPAQGTALFRILQEALTNVCRHANASSVDVSINRDQGDVVLRVRDDGRGLAAGDRSKPGAFGLCGIAERVRALGGSMSLAAALGGGVQLTVRVPVTGRWAS